MPFFSFWESPKDPSSLSASTTQSNSQSQRPITESQTHPQSQEAVKDQASSCPVDHKSREAWLAAARQQNASPSPVSDTSIPRTPAQAGLFPPTSKSQRPNRGEESLSRDRVISSIPRGYFNSSPPSSPSSAQVSQSQINSQLTSPLSPQTQITPSSSHSQTQTQTQNETKSHSNAETATSLTSPQGTWLYPSESQFFQALRRKNHNPSPRDMSTVIPIHNAVNERTWTAILQWEKGQGGESCGGPRLVSFSGDSSKTTPKAWVMGVLGYKRPFDRHDWIVERCGQRVEYVIDYYEGKKSPLNLPGDTTGVQNGGSMPVSFYIDARPKLNTIEGCRMRLAALLPF